MPTLKDDLTSKKFKPVYLLHGEERYLLAQYTKSLFESIVGEENRLMNYDVFDGKDADAARIIGAASTFPMGCGRRMVLVKDTALFAKKKSDAEEMEKYLPDIPPTTVIVFAETEADKRSRLFKLIDKTGMMVSCAKPTQGELNKWVKNVFGKYGKQISTETAALLLRTVSHGMDAVSAEAAKLAAYAGEREEITPEDIRELCSPTLESRIFDLVAASVAGNGKETLRLYRNMILLKESPFMILSMVVRQFRMILQCKAAQEKNMRRAEITQTLGIRDFAIDECASQGRRFSTGRLVQILESCRDMEVRVKSGLMDAETGVELLLLSFVQPGGEAVRHAGNDQVPVFARD